MRGIYLDFGRIAALLVAAALIGCLGTPVAHAQDAGGSAPEARSFTPPPRSIADITAILNQEKPDPAKVAEQQGIAGSQPPAGASDADLQKFYAARGDAADNLGRYTDAIRDMQMAVDLAARRRDTDPIGYAQALSNLARVNRRAGNRQVATGLYQQVAEIVMGTHQKLGMLFTVYEGNALEAARATDFAAANDWLQKNDSLLQQSGSWRQGGNFRNYYAATNDRAHGEVLAFQGRYAEAEPLLRRSIVEGLQAERDTAGESFPPRGTYTIMTDYIEIQLATVLNREGRPLEAEFEARRALLSELKLHGRYAPDSVGMITGLGSVLAEQGRYRDAEKLARTSLDTERTLGIDQASYQLNQARVLLASTLVAERRWAEALQQYDAIRAGLANNPSLLANALGQTLDLPVADLRGGRAQDGLQVARRSFEGRTRVLGDKHYNTVEAEGLLAAALAATGSPGEAQQHFTHAVPILLSAERQADDEDDTAPGLKDQRLQFIVETYLGVLAAQHSSDAAAEAFRVADAVRGRAVRHAVAAAAARANVTDPALAAVVRKEQDDQREVQALGLLLASEMALPDGQRDEAGLVKTRDQIEQLRADRTSVRQDIAKRFPDYVNLVDPQPATVSQVQAALRSGEALFAVYAGEDKSYVWAVPKEGAVAFAVSPLSRDKIEKSVAVLRKALDPDATTIEGIPAFRTDVAYELYASLLEPVRPGWQGAKSLLVVPHGALGQLPFALLVTAKTAVPDAVPGQTPFTGYKSVPWLIRQVAVTQLPSVTSLTTLRAIPPAPESRKPFLGFGDPWFNAKEADEARRESGVHLAAAAAPGGDVATRGAHIHLRSAPKTESATSAGIGQLPRLPDTAAEVTDVAAALKADPQHDVILGEQANERVVRTMKLDDRRVVMFATHGLVPGDLDGLNEPALALTAPSVAHVDGNGLLTVSKILGLHLNADWVVLSACNTAAGNGAGAEAVSGLGMAFFYAGSRALLVSNWPVETTAARVLTTDLFRRQAATPTESRAEALRQAEIALIDGPGAADPISGKPVFSYAHPLFWAPFSLVGDGGAARS
jgi:CHAT domain-containing protein